MIRSEIDPKYTWDLSSMYADQEAYDQDLKTCTKLIKELSSMKETMCASKQNFIQFMETQEKGEVILHNLICFARMNSDVDPDNENNQKNLITSMTLLQNASVALNDVPLYIIHHKETIESYLQDEDCKDFRYPMEEIFRSIPHHLSEQEELWLAQMQEISEVSANTFDAFRLEYQPVMVNGKEEFLNGGNYQQFLKNPDSNVREQAFTNYFQEYKRYQNVFMNLICGNAKAQSLNAKFRKFDSALQSSLFDDGVDENLFELVLKNGNETYIDYVHEYFAVRKKCLGLDTQHVYDIQLPLVDDVNFDFSIDQCFEILKKALLPLGEDYVKMLDIAKTERWIDFYPHAKKRMGAYSSGTHTSKPFILTNFTNDYDSLSTIAHEFGHSMHSYYSHKSNRPLLSGYKIFVAEVASTVNELLLNDYLLKNATDQKEKAFLLSGLLNKLVGTLFRQTMYAKFEADLHARMENGEALSSKDITDFYYDLNVNYFGDSVKVDDLQRYGCYYIPHFYYNFYVYKYTLGMSIAISFAKRILAGDVNDYRKFLTMGGSMSPLDELIQTGADPRNQKIYDEAFSYFKEVLDQFKDLMHID